MMQQDLFEELHAQFCGKLPPDLVFPPRLSVYTRTEVSDIEASVYEPVMCLILQGGKMVSVAGQSVNLTKGDALLVSHDLPVVSRITHASVDEPYIALILTLDLGLVRRLYNQISDTLGPVDDSVRPLAAGPAEADWLAPLVRYAALREDPMDADVLGPATLREIHYRLLLSPLGKMLRTYLVTDSQANRVARAIQVLRAGFTAPLSVPDLAKTAGMSPSSFHEHFKAVTGTTPLQYQKDLRLIEARARLVGGDQAVSEAAYAVGYESPTQFSREYSRKFGLPPSRDAAGVA